MLFSRTPHHDSMNFCNFLKSEMHLEVPLRLCRRVEKVRGDRLQRSSRSAESVRAIVTTGTQETDPRDTRKTTSDAALITLT